MMISEVSYQETAESGLFLAAKSKPLHSGTFFSLYKQVGICSEISESLTIAFALSNPHELHPNEGKK